MTGKTGRIPPMAQSFGLHTVLVLLILALSGLVRPDSAPVLIDFSLEESCTPEMERQAPPPPAAEKRAEGAQADAPPSAPDAPPHPAAARADNAAEPSPPAPEPDAAPLPAAALTPAPRVYAPVRAQVRPRAAAARPERTGRASASVPASGNQPSGAGVSPSPGEAREVYMKANFGYIREMVNKGVAYPPLARKMGWEGKVTVSFVVSRDGSVRDVKVVNSSGRDVLDRNALDAVAKAAPFPAPPVEAEVVLPIVYRLN